MKHYFNMHKRGMQWLFETREDSHFYFVNCFVSERLKCFKCFATLHLDRIIVLFPGFPSFYPRAQLV